ncbi:glycoside hydrolase family 2 protein [Cellulomonas sp. S1-8]|uniref:glycoside hydrolase family 2 protein n=1 Tax=Cellulomonas sp. S1-8 TaxID=2904790 RepID=UPI0022439C59|nr:glycoside hydrolase family 2 protein [Cellulomonas sp. S1-8]UZN04483.1 glycoside hydrolase family 2 protein [Cellulomonas sp. S1-8]
MIHDPLDDGWTLTAAADTLPPDLPRPLADTLRTGLRVRVPGTSHTHLLDAGLVPDPYLDRNEEQLAWMRRVDWAYERTLGAAPAGPGERVDLVLEGVDTVADVLLDGVVLARTANQHRTYRVDLRDHLRPGAQVLRVALTSALTYAEAEAARLGPRPAAYPQPFNMVRKMACSFGWDWGPDLQTAGLWRPVRLERWRAARLASVRPLVTVQPDGTGVVRVVVEIERSGLAGGDGRLVVTARVAGADAVVEVASGATAATVRLEVPHAPLWWPVGHGAQPLHDLRVELRAADPAAPAGPRGTGPVLGTWSRRIGFRSVELDTAPDDHGSAFTLRVNGRPLFVRGANWIPDDHLLTRLTRGRLAERLDQALGAHLNLLRVWGGGRYESEDFYELCDERGLLVWQDFLLACAAYPEESPLWEEIEAEAREHVARLTPHPSLVLWNGGNENLWGFRDWGWEAELEGRTWGRRYATELLPTIVAELDPTRPYLANSPASPNLDLHDVHPNDLGHGTHHQWDVWNRIDYTAYRDEVPRFCSEFGFQGPPTWTTLQRAVRAEDGTVARKEHPTFLLHQKAEDGNRKLDRGMAPHLGVPHDFIDWLWAAQLNQARAVRFAIEHYRSWWPTTAGAIVWQLNDCWPVTSWAAIDGDGRPKPSWWAMRAAFAERMVTVQPRDGREVLVVVNDTPTLWKATAVLERQTLDGHVLARAERPLTVGAWSVGTFPVAAALRTPDDPTREVLVVTLDRRRAVHTWLEDVDLALDPAPFDARVHPVQDGYEVVVTARALVRDLTLLVDRLDPDATVDDALVTLPAGTRATFRVRTSATLDAAVLTTAPVLRSANDVVVTRRVPDEPRPVTHVAGA